ncbi:Lrp/AsnC family transcriptional regulator [Rhodococcus sp. BP-252]|uniref:Lrp/AsnC family transcriptional regulator n=1 Tax=unclassified Rhodococcus (in: high G+C Gram-positive bacteria) TaxID=192944 RepID=UPI001C9AE4E8|nr:MULTISPECIES: Lrp/AsnC family transcriptional regulator [unclassified Rhodococcus (in: high G+C Gram-positive bacteria)]MBY6414664.1 Lrp/AsnC family transcriptional regulator [Rhodococcus sp. BP-320]MBY6419489.1 Lrp/AsnC family transcriptional regulator [Rhodococcus sp. BP-321]MBY6424499.1 Lrp/AsnC family transcriptional regulator [Rhodococcus sp. BP-324]MBY6429500.1 Lrp/AsnC family transcriptional regulator [Rhodococcus sp. BP-323]MBY6434509.1 Lrp/AsnC family transcriptional regulator [Rho
MQSSGGSEGQIDRKIAAALQIDGRSPWTRIAAAIGESERTVSRRGSNLLESGQVRVRAFPNPARTRRAEGFVVKVACNPGTAAIATSALAQRSEVVYAYMLTGAADCAAELEIDRHSVETVITRDLASIPGISSVATYPVLNYFMTMHQWKPVILTEAEVDALNAGSYFTAPNDVSYGGPLRREDRQIISALSNDGRASLEDLTRACGLSVQTVRKRVDLLRRDGTMYLRAVFEPDLLGLDVEVLLWVKVGYPDIDRVGDLISASRVVRYAAVVAGDYQLIVNAVFRNRAEFYRYLRDADWVRLVHSIEPTVVMSALKRSGVTTGSGSIQHVHW